MGDGGAGTHGVGPRLDFREAQGECGPYVATYYLYRNDAPVVDGVERVDCGQIRFLLKGEGTLSYFDGGVVGSVPVMVNGPARAAATYHVEGGFHCFGVSLRPIGWRALIGRPAHRVPHVIDGRELFGDAAYALLEQLRGMDSVDAMIAAVEPLLLAHRRPVPKTHLLFARAVREWSASEDLDIDALYDAVPLARRQVMRLCNEYFAGPPMHLRRKFRAIWAAMRLYHGESPADVVGMFCDQPHMINEVKRYTGLTPGALQSRIDPVLAATLDEETFRVLPEIFPESLDPGGK